MMTSHNDIEQLRRADTALREALRQRAGRLPSLSEDFVERTLSRLDAEQPSATTPPMTAQRPIRRLWPLWVAAAAAFVAVVVMTISPEQGGNEDVGKNVATASPTTAISAFPTTVVARVTTTASPTTATSASPTTATSASPPTATSASSTTATSASSLPTPSVSVRGGFAAASAPIPTDSASVPPSTPAPRFHIDEAKVQRHIARTVHGNTTFQRRATRHTDRRLALAVHYSANFRGRSGYGYDDDVHNPQFQIASPSTTEPDSPGNIGTGDPDPQPPSGNGGGGKDGKDGNDGHDAADSTATVKSRAIPATRSSGSNDDEGTYSHNLPISLGVMLRIPLHQRFSVETGLTYTYLRSAFDHKDDGFTQHIHYLGIPLQATARIIGNRHWQAYTTVGAAMDIPVRAYRYGRVTDHSLTLGYRYGNYSITTRVQFSTNIGLGLQYDFNPHLGIYVQPSLQWFIPTGGDIETYRTEHPLQFTLPIGLRITL